mmetsp:Transcript_72863/g.206760  ORF Transcript_72863/g.206760 Transcript_72863/m.206760 type:complete len:272 (+) Transcript_72863:951-1766(+)
MAVTIAADMHYLQALGLLLRLLDRGSVLVRRGADDARADLQQLPLDAGVNLLPRRVHAAGLDVLPAEGASEPPKAPGVPSGLLLSVVRPAVHRQRVEIPGRRRGCRRPRPDQCVSRLGAGRGPRARAAAAAARGAAPGSPAAGVAGRLWRRLSPTGAGTSDRRRAEDHGPSTRQPCRHPQRARAKLEQLPLRELRRLLGVPEAWLSAVLEHPGPPVEGANAPRPWVLAAFVNIPAVSMAAVGVRAPAGAVPTALALMAASMDFIAVAVAAV